MPSIKNSQGKIVTEEEYQRLLHRVAMDKSKFSRIKGDISGQSLLKKLFDNIFVCYDMRHLFIVKATFQKYTEVDEALRKMVTLTFPIEDEWEHLINLIA